MSISLEDLKQVQTIYVHKNCPDGTASAMLLKHALKVPVVFLQYGTEEYLKLQAVPGMLFCDTTPPHDRVQEFVDVRAIVLDHHKGAQAVVAKFGDHGVFADELEQPGVCGAVLAYREVLVPLLGPEKSLEDFAKLAGIRDTWQTKDPRWNEACAQSSWLLFFGEEECLKEPIFGDADRWSFHAKVGEMLFTQHMRKIADGVAGAVFTNLHGLKIAMLQNVSYSSDAAELLGEESKVDILVAFSYYNEKMILSCRTRTNFDVSKLAKFYGGGGHTKAAGFTLKVEDWHRNPYSMILNTIDEYWKKQGSSEQSV